MCKKQKFDHTNQWYLHNPEPFLENELHKHIRDFELQTYHVISSNTTKKRKKTCRILDSACPADHIVKIRESEKRDRYLDLT